MADMEKFYDDLIIINLYNGWKVLVLTNIEVKMVQMVFQTTKVVLVIFTAAHSRGCQDGRGGRLQGSLQNTLFKDGKISKRNLDYRISANSFRGNYLFWKFGLM